VGLEHLAPRDIPVTATTFPCDVGVDNILLEDVPLLLRQFSLTLVDNQSEYPLGGLIKLTGLKNLRKEIRIALIIRAVVPSH
jgi:hypothetical protein